MGLLPISCCVKILYQSRWCTRYIVSLRVLMSNWVSGVSCIVDLVFSHRCCVCQGVAAEEPLFSSSLWGPSEDDLDQVLDQCLLPELAVGDWLLFLSAGANSLRTAFTNGDEPKPPVFYTITERDWYEWTSVSLVSVTDSLNLIFLWLIDLGFFVSSGKRWINVASVWTGILRTSLWYRAACSQTCQIHRSLLQPNTKFYYSRVL